MGFIDSHCHIDFSEFDHIREQLIEQCKQQGINAFIVPGVTLAQSKALIELAKCYGCIRISAGLHPYFLSEHREEHLAQLTEFALHHRNKISAIGECGIDRSIDDIPLQIRIFEHQIGLANQLNLPLIVHHRQSHDLIAHSFKRCRPKYGGVIHAFTGSAQQAQSYIKQGFKLGVGGSITYERAQKTRHVISQLDAKHLLLETDSPSMPLCGFQGQINTPLQLPRVFEQLCTLKQLTDADKAQLKKQLYESCSALFCI